MRSGTAGANLPEIGTDIFYLRKDLVPLGEGFAIDYANFRMSGLKKVGHQMSPNEPAASRYEDLSSLLHAAP
jgi:hypothetical protein